MAKKMKIIGGLFAIIFVITIIVGLGVYKFNFTDNDIYIPDDSQIKNLDSIPTKEIDEGKDIPEVKKTEGKADIVNPLASEISLNLHPWFWIKTVYLSNKEIKNVSPLKFSLTFKKDLTFGASTDCNVLGGEYVISGNKITFKNIISTMMYCENSQEKDFIKMLTDTQSYSFTSKGQLVLSLKSDDGSAIFK